MRARPPTARLRRVCVRAHARVRVRGTDGRVIGPSRPVSSVRVFEARECMPVPHQHTVCVCVGVGDAMGGCVHSGWG